MITPTRKVVLGIFSFLLCAPSLSLADIYHYKELLIADRGANLAGAYSAVADDSSGAYYNPAGLMFGAKDSMTGISNATNFVYNDYKKAVEDESQLMEGWRYLINFMGYMKRVGDSVFGLSYVIDDSTEIHQDQEFENKLVLNRRSDDRTYKYGPTFAHQFTESFSWGVTLYAFQRKYYSQLNRLLDTKDSQSKWRFENINGSEFGIHLKTGCIWAPTDEWAFALLVKKTVLTHSSEDTQINEKIPGSDTVNYSLSSSRDNHRRVPLGITVGIAWFPSAYTMISTDFDYYKLDDEGKIDVLNYSIGVEYFINEQNVIRGGVYTNYDNRKAPDSTTEKGEKIDMIGLSVGYSIFNGPAMITVGAVGCYGRGKIQTDPENPTDIQDSIRETYSFSLAVSYNVDD